MTGSRIASHPSEQARDVVVIGAGHNGLACACFLAGAGLSVTVLERSTDVGGCIYTVDVPDRGARLEIGGYEHGGLRASGVAAELELESRWGLRMIEREELLYAPCDDGTGLAFHSSLDRTVAELAAVVGAEEAERYRDFCNWARPAAQLISVVGGRVPPSMRELAAVATATMGTDGARLVQTILSPASAILRTWFRDERLRGALGQWSANSQQPPSDPGTGAGTLLLAAMHGYSSARPAGGSRATIDALVRCLEGRGGSVHTGVPVDHIEVQGGRAVAVHAGGSRYPAKIAVVSSLDPVQVFTKLLSAGDVPAPVATEVARMHSGIHNVAELKIDAVVARPEIPVTVPGFERAYMVSANTLTELEASFAEIALGTLPRRPALMLAVPSSLEPGWAPVGQQVLWVQSRVPWQPAGWRWTADRLDEAARTVWSTVERAFGCDLEVVEWKLTGPPQWCDRHGGTSGNPNHLDMSIDQLLDMRPSPSLSKYRTPIAGLYLTGAGTHPGGGISGISGRNTAHQVLRAAKVGGRRQPGQRVREQAGLMRDALRAVRAIRRG
jgi:beta-carotene ketolase (CrtO type)